jgi:hypothetical protein
MTTPTAELPTPKSKLLPIGILFIVVGLLGRQPLAKAVVAMQPSLLRGVLSAVTQNQPVRVE